MAKKIIAVCGLRNKFRDGPNIIRNNPMIEEMKNLGKRKTFSQKVGIYLIVFIFLSDISCRGHPSTINLLYTISHNENALEVFLNLSEDPGMSDTPPPMSRAKSDDSGILT